MRSDENADNRLGKAARSAGLSHGRLPQNGQKCGNVCPLHYRKYKSDCWPRHRGKRYDQTREIHGLTPQEIIDQEPELLKKAKQCIPTVIPTKLDVLVVDQMGKNFGGDGMDANVTRKFLVPGMEQDPEAPACIVPLSLSEETHGNAMGIGVADATTRRLFDAMDFEATYPNALTAAIGGAVQIPMVLDSDKHAIQAAIRSVWGANMSQLRIVRIPNTLHIEYIEVSEALLPELQDRSDIEILSEPYDWNFDENGNLF